MSKSTTAILQGLIDNNILPPNAPNPFLIGNFRFASVHDGVIGSLYFADAGGHQRIRLAHNHGPRISNYHANGEWYFPPVGTAFPLRNATTLDINVWITGPPVIPNAPVAGNQIIEYAAGHINSAGRHVSRGLVVLPLALNLTQRDMNIIYWTITGLPLTSNVIEPVIHNAILRESILINNLTPALQQEP